MTSRRGVLGAAWMLMAFPMALLLSRWLGDAETLLHLFLGVGCVLVAGALFDFGTSRWIAWLGGVGLGLLGAIFLLQATSDLLALRPLHALAYEVLGQVPERVLPDLFFVWCLATLWQHSRGGMRRLGACVMALVVVVDLFDYGMSLRGGDAPGILKLSYLLPFAWLLLESRRPRGPIDERRS